MTREKQWTAQELRATRADYSPDAGLRTLQRFRTGLPAINQVKGPLRRQRTHVPTPDGGGTSLGLGWKRDGLLYPGFGVDTVGHFVANARGGKGPSTMTMQASGQLVVQSDDDGLWLVSRAPSVLASTKVSNVLGSGGVVIAAGWEGVVVNPTVTGMGPLPPTASATVPGHMAALVGAWARWDSAVAGAATQRGQVEAKIGPKVPTDLFDGVSRFAEVAALGCVANNVLAQAGESTAGGVHLHGAGGLTLGTPRYGAIHAALGLSIVSARPTILGLEHVDIHAADHVKVSSAKRVVVEAQEAVLVASADGNCVVVSRHDEVLVSGPIVQIGSFQTTPPQDPAKIVNVISTEHIGIFTNPESPDEAAGIWIGSKQGIDVKAQDEVSVWSAKNVRSSVDDKLFVTIESEPRVVAARTDASQLTLYPDRAILQHTPLVGLHATRDGVRLGAAPARAGEMIREVEAAAKAVDPRDAEMAKVTVHMVREAAMDLGANLVLRANGLARMRFKKLDLG